MSDEFITSGEFARWRSDFQAFQGRLDGRLDKGFDGLNDRLDDLNGRTGENAKAIIALDSRVENIRTSGCSQVKAHRNTLDRIASPEKWHQDKRVWVGGAGGASIVAALYEIAKAVQAAYKGAT